MQNEWIMFADRRPRIGQRCLLCLNGYVQHISYVLVQGDDGGPFWSDCIWEDNAFDALDGHFWMLLPEPPKVMDKR